MYQFNRKTVKYEGGGHQVEIEVREAGRLQGIRRLDYIDEAKEWLEAQGYKPGSLEDTAKIPQDVWQIFLVTRFERSACLAAAVSLDGVPEEWLSVEGFAETAPEELVIDWVNAAYELNDHWERVYRKGIRAEVEAAAAGAEGDAEKKD